MKKLFIFAVLSLLMIGCTDDEPVSVPNAMKQSAKENEHRVSLQDALKRAESLLSQIGDPATRSKTRKVKSVEYLQNQLTRSGAIDTTLYLVNYEDNAGFALLGADDRVRPIYAISDEGRLNMEDTVENKGLALFFRNTEAEIANSPVLTESGDTFIYIGPPINPEPLIQKTLIEKVGPLLGYHQRRWHQGSPFNMYSLNSNGTPINVGCATLAIAQVMSFYAYPSNYRTDTFPWGAMNSGYANERVAKFLRVLGNPENLDHDYDISTGLIVLYPIRTTFANMGYHNIEGFKFFNEEEVVSILQKGNSNIVGGGPVLMAGSSFNSGGHVWVIDGYLLYELSGTAIYGNKIDDYLFHCVWGWQGQSDGYYYWAKSHKFSGDPIERENDESGISNNPNLNYEIEIMYFGGVIPNN